MPGCTKTDRSEEAQKLSEELINTAISNLDKTLERIDSAEEAGVFTALLANTVKACIYENASRHRMAAYYAEKAIAAEEDYIVTTSADSSNYCKPGAALLPLAALRQPAHVGAFHPRELPTARETERKKYLLIIM